MVKVLFIVTEKGTVPSVRGGAFETMTTDFIEINETEQRMNITVVSRSDEQAAECSKKYPGTRFVYIDYDEKERSKFEQSGIVRFVNKIGYKVLGQIIWSPGYVRKLLKILRGEQFDYIVIMGGNPEEYGALTRRYGREKMLFNVGAVMSAGKVADKTYGHFLCCSQYVANQMKSNHYIEDNRIRTFLNAVDTGLFMQNITHAERQQLRERYHLAEDDIVILFMGRLSREKGVLELLEAYARMQNRDKCKLLVVGKQGFGYGVTTEYETQLKAVAGRISENISFTGYIHHQELWKILKICDFAVYPSIWEEPAGNVVPETMAAGLPLIITNSGGMVEYVTSKSAIVVEKDEKLTDNLAKAMDMLAQDEELRKRMGEAARLEASSYDMKPYYEKTLRLFEELKR